MGLKKRYCEHCGIKLVPDTWRFTGWYSPHDGTARWRRYLRCPNMHAGQFWHTSVEQYGFSCNRTTEPEQITGEY